MTATLPDRRDMDETIHTVASEIDATFTWDYERSRPALEKLYEKAKTSQWNATTDLPWDTDVDPEKVASELQGGTTARFHQLSELPNSPIAHFGDKEWLKVGVEIQSSLLSQFLHGEQGALLCTARIVETVPWIDAKYYASTQVMDEARHVEVFGRYLNEKLTSQYRINANLKSLLDDILADSRWDITYLGMQIMVEGLALAAFGLLHQITTEPLLKQMLRYVMSDEARHVAFGVLSLKELYQELTTAEIRERQEFALDAAVRLKRRFVQTEVWERMGVDPGAIVKAVDENPPPQQQMFQTMLFSKIVPNCKKLGLLDAADGWLREKFTDLGIIQFEDWVDTGEEYEQLDEVARDRAATV
jgi:P-aminobenzoate N-oxygenase AurF